MAGATSIVLYLLRHDLRVSDNPIFYHLATSSEDGFTHLLPVFIFPAHQMEVSGLILDGSKPPYPEARSTVGRYWRCGPHRARFIAQSVWALKTYLEDLGSGLVIRAGMMDHVLQSLLSGLAANGVKVGAVWMTAEEGVEEIRDARAIASVCSEHNVNFRLWADEKYYIDE
jgi:deoxyribodipyrimidine photo-lyase